MRDPSNPTHRISPLYARYLTAAEKRALRATPSGNVSSEINLVRVLLAHFMEIQQSSPSDFFSRIQGLRTCLLMVEQLGVLVQSHDRDHSAFDELEAAIEKAVEEMQPYWKLA